MGEGARRGGPRLSQRPSPPRPPAVKNYELLLSRVASWMAPGGTFFVHIFTHKDTPFHYTGAPRGGPRTRRE